MHDVTVMPARSWFGRGFVVLHHSVCPCGRGMGMLITRRDERKFYSRPPGPRP